jgi:hypothetical protein
MMNQHFKRARAIGLIVVAAVMVACTDFLDVPREGLVTDEHLGTAAAANAMRVGVLTGINSLTGGVTGGVSNTSSQGALWGLSGLLADEWRASNNSAAAIGNTDRRNPLVTAGGYSTIYDIRFRIYLTIPQLRQFLPAQPIHIGQMYFVLGLVETYLAEYFCNGTPLSRVVNGVVEYGAPLPNRQVLDSAIAHFDSALVYLPASSAPATELRRAAQIMRARAYLGRDNAASVDANGIASASAPVAPAVAAAIAAADSIYANTPNYVYAHTYAANQLSNENWSVNFPNNGGAFMVEDTVAPNYPAAGSRRGAAIGFASANDPRVLVVGTTLAPGTPPTAAQGGPTAFDGTRAVRQLVFGQFTRNNIVSALDARLMSAEVDLRAGNYAAMTAKLNALRATTYPVSQLVTYNANALPALAVPTTANAAAKAFFREKAFWTFGRGQRMPDLRRMLRQYGTPYGFANDDAVFPSGVSNLNAAPFEHAVNFAIPDAERTNPNVVAGTDGTMCVDRKP